jgi:ProP effector
MVVDSQSAKVSDTLATLAGQFPQAFSLGDQRRPLKVGIHQDVAARIGGLSNNQIQEALRQYTSEIHYLRAIVEGAARIDLDGNSAGTVTAHQAAIAKKCVKMAKKGKQVSRAEQPRRSSLADLRAAALARRAGAVVR